MNTIYDMTFKRKFSVNLYKNIKLMLAQMDCFKDWISNKQGDPYPILSKEGEVRESIADCCYVAEGEGNSFVRRLIGAYVPFSTQEVKVSYLDEHICGGISVISQSELLLATLDVYLKRVGESVKIYYALNGQECEVTKETFPYQSGMALTVTLHHGNCLDVFLRYGETIRPISFFSLDELLPLRNEKVFRNAVVASFARFDQKGSLSVLEAKSYLDSGVSQADMKPIRYEDGKPLMEQGKLFMTMTSRLGREMMQSILSWNPSTCEFHMEGALFFDAGDGDWCGDVASSLIFDRNEKNWKLWMASFAHGHILGHAQFESDPRFGVNVIDVTLMETKEGSLDTEFYAMEGDEDPDFYFDKETNKWYMTICRWEGGELGKYRYFLFESEKPFEGYTFVSKTSDDAVTGGIFTLIGGKRYFICGANADKRAQYLIYDAKDFSKPQTLRCNYDDGGCRGWGTVIPVPCGTRTKYVWITFDRHNASDYNWSYGTLYGYEADLMNQGYEWPDIS